MATVQKRSNSYKITVSCGYDTSGKQIRKTMTWSPAPNMTAKQIEKELERQKVLFEERCQSGMFVDGKIKLSDFAELWYKNYAEKQLKAETYYMYRQMQPRIDKYLGHIRLDRIQPHHLLEFYNIISEEGEREDTKYKPDIDFKVYLKSKNITPIKLAEMSSLSIETIRSCIKGNNVSKGSAYAICTALQDKTLFNAVDKGKKLSGYTILHYHRLLSSILSTAVEWQLLTSNPCSRVKPPKTEQKEANYLDEIQAQELVNCLANEPLRYRTMIMLLLYSGMRRGELCGLTWDDIDFKYNLVNITKSNLYLPGKGIFEDTTKNKSSERIIQVPRDMIELLAEYKKEQLQMRLKVGDKWNESGKIFTTPFSDPIHPDSLSSWFSKFIKKNNLPDIHLHSLRHTNATLLIANGTNIRTVAKRLGHASPTTTGNIYAHAIKTADEMASDTLQDILNQRKKSLKIQK